jgi:outer membrane cobalamin receptor
MKRLATAALIGLLTHTAGCFPAASPADGSNVSPRGRTVSAEEIANSSASTAWEALSLLGAFIRLEEDKDQQPARITSRGRSSINLSSEPLIFMDGVRLVEYRVLHSIGAHLVEKIQFITGPEASIRYGTNAGNGVILITTRST